MKKKKSYFRNFIFFALLIFLTFYIMLKDQDIFGIFNILKSAKIKFVVVGIICMFVFLSLEAFNLGRNLRNLNEKTSPIKNLKYAFIGFFFSSITPAASGGQPMQVYYMHKDNISVANSTLALLINLASMQIVTIGFALISVIFNYQYLTPVLIVFFIIGLLLNFSALMLLIIAIFSRRMSRGLLHFTLKVLKFFKAKNIDEKRERYEQELQKYQQSAVYIRNNKILIGRTLMVTLIQFTFYYSITYWVYRALGFNQYNIMQIITMQSVLFATVSGIPSPGAVGVSEGAFMEIFKKVYPKNMISSAVLLSRGINFYLYVFISGIITIISHIISRKTNKAEDEEEGIII